MKLTRCPLALAALGFLASSGVCQNFGPQQVITTAANGVFDVYATDLDGDADADVLSASWNDNKIAWYENLGGGAFGPQQIISSIATAANSVYATDLDGDGDADVLATLAAGQITWYENLGGGTFGPQQVITTLVGFPYQVYATDLDGDADADVLSASWGDDKIAWYENLGGGTFGPQQVITTLTSGATHVYATDLDGDGDADVLSASEGDDKIAWYENLGGGAFGPQQVITILAMYAQCVYATDLDGDGDADVLSASWSEDKIAWYENLGGGAFGPQQVITTFADGAYSVYATDLDGDGDADVLSASGTTLPGSVNKIAWYENLSGGAFGPQQVITTEAKGAVSVYATDLDGDCDADVLSASFSDDKIAWYENLTAEPGTSFCTAKTGLACGTPAMASSGISSAAATSGFTLRAGPARTCKPGILVYNTNQAPGVAFQGGTLCIETMGLRRAGPANSMGTPGGANCDGEFTIDMNAFGQGAWVVPDCAGSPSGLPPTNPAAFLTVPGTSVFAQFWGRDSVATGSFVSSGLSWAVCP